MTEPDGYTESTEVETSVGNDGAVQEQTVTEHVEADTQSNDDGSQPTAPQ